MGLLGRVQQMLRSAAAGGLPNDRTTGSPTSANGASSFHLFWQIDPIPLAEVRATISISQAPTTPHLYFWALQAGFADVAGRQLGAGHFGLQHHPDYPDNGAVNWGGYFERGGELPGSVSTLGSAIGNPNTSNYRWRHQRRYQYRIYRSPERGWRGAITDLGSGQQMVARDLWISADHLTHPMVWSEIFAPCDAPATVIAWTDLHGMDHQGNRIDPYAATVNYQALGNGGCSNTDIELVNGALLQRTTTTRRTKDRTNIKLD
jgi:hypothetical protein